ncbi:MAG: four helix bundle protein [Pseudomonadota bacterium]|jgi:four helix bundle protein
MSKVTCFEDLIAWQKARTLAGVIIRLTKGEGISENYGLKDQLCRAAISIPANIAEGFELDGNREFLKFLSIAKGSAGEVRSLLHISFDLGYITRENMKKTMELALETSRLIGGLMRNILNSNKKGRKFK